MSLPELSVKRPVLATVISLVILLFGLVAYQSLSVRQYPDIDPPIISVTTTYLGAPTEIIENQITEVIEDAVSGITGVREIRSTSRDESSSVSIEFTLDRDIDAAAADVRDRVARAIGNLPDAADTPQVAKADSDARPIIWLVLRSDVMDQLALTDMGERLLADRLATVAGVASVRIGGSRRYAMRIDLKPAELAARGLTVQDIELALRAQNVEIPAGRVEGPDRELSVRADSRLDSPEGFARVIVSQDRNYLVRLGEVADIRLGAESDRSELRSDGRAAVGLGVIRQSKSNTLAVAQGVKDLLPELRDGLPPGVELDVAYDESVFIEGSIHEVYIAIGVAGILVILVIFIFLRSVRATLIPAVAIPVSVIGSFTVLAALGYSVNVLTLLALVLAIGLVVDDAIVVLENVHRRIEGGEPPLLAAVRGTRQIQFAILATTVVLVAVFVPLSFLEGNVGRLFREFGIAVAAAVIFSCFVALSLTPMLCSRILKPRQSQGMLIRLTEPAFRGMTSGYRFLLRGVLAVPVLVLAAAVLVSACAWLLFQALPQELSPAEDRGAFYISIVAPEGSTTSYTRQTVLEVEEILGSVVERGLADRVLMIIAPGFGRPGEVNRAFGVVRLKHWHERDVSQQEVVNEIFPRMLALPGARAFAINPPGLGQGAFSPPVQFIIGGPEYAIIDEWADRIIEAAEQNPRLLNLNKTYNPTQPKLTVLIDRDRAADLGIPLNVLGRTLETFLGERTITEFPREGKTYDVRVRASAGQRGNPSALRDFYVRAASGELVPLANLVQLQEVGTAPSLDRVDRMRSITLEASLGPGYPLGEALEYLEAIAAEELPPSARVSYGGQSREFKDSASALAMTFALAILIVFLALAAQFESFVHPTTIILSVPLAVTGALATLLLVGGSLNVYSQIGIIMLVGLTAKNAILIVEFANQLRDQGQSVHDAVLDAATIRLRPILMTTLATILGAVPLAVGSGAGSEARAALGIVIVGGMGFATVLSLFVVPALYLMLAPLSRPAGHVERQLDRLQEEELVAAEQDAAEKRAAAERAAAGGRVGAAGPAE